VFISPGRSSQQNRPFEKKLSRGLELWAKNAKHFEPVVGDVQQSREVPLLALVTLLLPCLGLGTFHQNWRFFSRDDSAVSFCLEVVEAEG
jgi:hypothetical protein